MFINMKAVPSPDSDEYEAFSLNEWKKVRDGVTIDGVYISGWLYWHINHWKIQVDNEKGDRVISTPFLRDNEWMIAEGLERAEREKKILCVFGARQSGKTSYSASYIARKATVIVNSQNLIIGSSKPDLNNITGDLDFGMQNVTEMFRIPRITRNWSSPEVYLGVKTKEGDNQIHSMFRIRNTEGGKNTEVTAGSRASSALIDEAGKGPFAKVLEALRPALRGPFGWRAPILVTGTGGAFDKGRDAELMFFHPDSNDVVEYVDEMSGRKTGLFMPGWVRQDFKKETNLAQFLGKESKKLAKIPMMVSDKELAVATLKEERVKVAKDPDGSKLLKRIMYDPLSVEEIFLTESDNFFPQDLIIDQKQFLQRVQPHKDNVELYLDSDGKVRHKFTEKKPIAHYPHQQDDNLEGVIEIFEYPMDNLPSGIYIAGIDPYKFSQAQYSDSVGSVYVFKRTYDITSDKFQNMMVACYHGRPKKLQTWYDNVKNLLKFYNAKGLCENMDYGFIQHLIDKNEASQLLVPTPRFLYDIHPNTTVGDKRMYGIHMTEDIKNYLYTSILEYLFATIKKEIDPVSGETVDVLGIRKVIDPLLLEEMLKYNSEANVDRIISFGLVVAYSKSLDKIPLKTTKDNRYESYSKKNKPGSGPFKGSSSSTPFRKLT